MDEALAVQGLADIGATRPAAAARPIVPDSGLIGQLWHGAAPAPGLDEIAQTGIRLSRAGPLGAGRWAPTEGAAGWLHEGHLSLGFHGEVLNGPELAQQLGLPPSTTTLALMLAGWKRWGDALFGRMDGVFSAAVNQPGKLTLYRDPSGLSGLYVYADGGWHVSFATDLQALLLLPRVERRISRRSLHEFLRFLEIAAPNTFFEHVIAPEPGRVYTWPDGTPVGVRSRTRLDEAPPAAYSEAIDRLDGHLRHSVQARIGHTSSPAAFLSGGVDSALLCAIASKCHPGVKAITVGFDLEAYDESPTAQRIADHLSLPHEVLRFTHSQFRDALDRFSAGAEQPMADPASLATLLAFEHCREHHDVVLDGTGADEAVGMMPPRHIRMAVSAARLLPDALRHGLARLTQATPGLGGFTPILDVEHPAEMMIPWNGFSRAEIAAMCGEPVSFTQTHFYETYARELRSGHFALYSALIDAVPCERLTQAMRISGARIRFPFSEAGTDGFLRSLPADYRYRPAEPKRILRGLLDRYVPMPIWDGPKHGFNFPLDDFLGREDFAIVRRNLDPDLWREWDLLSPDEVHSYARRYMAGDPNLTFRIWSLVVLSAWMQHHRPLR